MNTVTTKDGAEIYYKDWGAGQPVVFSHGWPLSSEAWAGSEQRRRQENQHRQDRRSSLHRRDPYHPVAEQGKQLTRLLP